MWALDAQKASAQIVPLEFFVYFSFSMLLVNKQNLGISESPSPINSTFNTHSAYKQVEK